MEGLCSPTFTLAAAWRRSGESQSSGGRAGRRSLRSPRKRLKGDGRLGQGTGLTALEETGRRGPLEIKIQGAKETTMDRIRGEGERGVQKETWISDLHHLMFKTTH